MAIDIARLLVKTRDELSPSDITNAALEALLASSVTDVYMLGRRGPVEAKFTNVELREMGKLENCVPQIVGTKMPDSVPAELDMSDRDRRLRERNLATLREFVPRQPDELEKRVHFQFYAAPREIFGGDHVKAIRLERTEVIDGRAVGAGEFFEIETKGDEEKKEEKKVTPQYHVLSVRQLLAIVVWELEVPAYCYLYATTTVFAFIALISGWTGLTLRRYSTSPWPCLGAGPIDHGPRYSNT